MIKIKDMYISLNNIKQMYFDQNDNDLYMVVLYFYDEDRPIKIAVDNYGEYMKWADMIMEAVK